MNNTGSEGEVEMDISIEMNGAVDMRTVKRTDVKGGSASRPGSGYTPACR